MKYFIYEIAEEKKDLGEMDETLFYEYVPAIFDQVNDYFKDLDYLFSLFQEHGVMINKENYSFCLTTKAKENLFAERFKKTKEEVANMDLNTFATSDLFTLRKLIYMDFDAYVFDPVEESIKQLDRWIREAKTNTVYYVGNIVCAYQ